MQIKIVFFSFESLFLWIMLWLCKDCLQHFWYFFSVLVCFILLYLVHVERLFSLVLLLMSETLCINNILVFKTVLSNICSVIMLFIWQVWKVLRNYRKLIFQLWGSCCLVRLLIIVNLWFEWRCWSWNTFSKLTTWLIAKNGMILSRNAQTHTIWPILRIWIKTWYKGFFCHWVLFVVIDDLAVQWDWCVSFIVIVCTSVILYIGIGFISFPCIIQHLNIFNIFSLWFSFLISIFNQTIISFEFILTQRFTFSWNLFRFCVWHSVLEYAILILTQR